MNLNNEILNKYTTNPNGSYSIDQSLDNNQKICQPAKRSWSQGEDAKLIQLVEDHGSLNWSIIAENFPGRTGKQCRERYNNHLQPNIKKGDWTPEEDLIIVEMQAKYGNHWSKITKMLPGRTDNAIKNRWHAAVRATSRGTYTKDCGLLSNIRRQPIIPRLPLDNISNPDSELKYNSYPIQQTVQQQLPQNQQQYFSSNSFEQIQSPIQGVENLVYFTNTLMALAHEHTHSHIKPLNYDQEMLELTSEMYNKEFKQCNNISKTDYRENNLIMLNDKTMNPNIQRDQNMLLNKSINSINTMNQQTDTMLVNNILNKKIWAHEANLNYNEFDWKSPRYSESEKSSRIFHENSESNIEVEARNDSNNLKRAPPYYQNMDDLKRNKTL